MGAEEDKLKLDKLEKEIQPDDAVNIQYTSVNFYYFIFRPLFLIYFT